MEWIHKQEELIFAEYQELLGGGREGSADGLLYLGESYYDCEKNIGEDFLV